VPEFASVDPPERDVVKDVAWSVSTDVLTRVTAVSSRYGGGPWDTRHGGRISDRYEGFASMPTSDPALATAGGTVRFTIEWPEASVAVESNLMVASSADAYQVDIALDAFEAGELIAERRWSRRIPRRLA
jgi:hypothetical protein